MARSKWKSINIYKYNISKISDKSKTVLIRRKNMLITSNFLDKTCRILTGRYFSTIVIKSKKAYLRKFGEFVLTRKPFMHLRLREKKKRLKQEKERLKQLAKLEKLKKKKLSKKELIALQRQKK